MLANLENSAMVTGLEKFSFHSSSKEEQCKKMFKVQYNFSHFAANKIRLTIPQAKLQQYVNQELSDVQAGFRKGRGTRDEIASIHWIIKQAREFQKNVYFCFIDYAKSFDCVDHNKLWKVLKGQHLVKIYSVTTSELTWIHKEYRSFASLTTLKLLTV